MKRKLSFTLLSTYTLYTIFGYLFHENMDNNSQNYYTIFPL